MFGVLIYFVVFLLFPGLVAGLGFRSADLPGDAAAKTDVGFWGSRLVSLGLTDGCQASVTKHQIMMA